MAGLVGSEILNKVSLLSQRKLIPKDEIRAIHMILDQYLEDLLSEEKIHFTTLFTKISYLSLQRKFTKELHFFLHRHRRNITNENNSDEALATAKYALFKLVLECEEDLNTSNYAAYFPKPEIQQGSSSSGDQLTFARVHVFGIDEASETLTAYNEEHPDDKIKIKLNTKRNADFNSLLRFLKRTQRFPVTLHLSDIEVHNEVYDPDSIVFEPDYLVDITTVSECYKPDESSPLFYFLKKFIPVYQNKYLIIGNIANFFVDELFYDSSTSFHDLIKKTFRLSPLGFSMMNDAEVREVVSTLRTHFQSIKDVIENHFTRHGISTENSMLEPSFYAPKYGFQGRLDLYSESPTTKGARIVELKSGRPYKANSYGLNINHYVQTLLYDLMVNTVTNHQYKVSSFILYSSQPDDPLRFAPPLKVQQRDAIRLRNQLVEIDYLLADVDIDNDHLFSYINSNSIKSDGFAKRDIDKFQKIYSEASSISKKYFNAFTAFIAREQILAKTGEFGLDKSSGLAGLWLDDMREKIENFQVLNALQVFQVNVAQQHTIITLSRTDETATNANFRLGDLGVLYPYTHGNESVLNNQIYKCSIIDLNQKEVKVRLRNKQQNTQVFREGHKWHIEHDHLDHGFNAMYQSLFHFLGTKQNYQRKILGLRPPTQAPAPSHLTFDSYVTAEQAQLLNEMIVAPEYYLLWGPPGTGKTSVLLYEYLKYIFQNTEERVLILAYTNRAVDEICEAIHRISKNIQDYYFRIGSRYSSHSKFADNLLVSKLEEIQTRAEMLKLIQGSRLFVSTLASISGKKELFSIVEVDTIVVDEASQILEPQLVGMLSRAPKFILVGDHYQLPAIVRQREDESSVSDPELAELGLVERRNSLFERLYKRCQEQEWKWAVGRLSQQGRMHKDIMKFVNEHFYDGILSVIPSQVMLQLESEMWGGSRMLYIPVPTDPASINYKTNEYEASAVAKVITGLLTFRQPAGLAEIGVITPYRAQISAINIALSKSTSGTQNDVNVDTVERYQGGARDYIILSLCLNTESQLQKLVSLSSDGIDRKLNVALTRARRQIIIVGNEAIMSKNPGYAYLLKEAKRLIL